MCQSDKRCLSIRLSVYLSIPRFGDSNILYFEKKKNSQKLHLFDQIHSKKNIILWNNFK